VTVLLQISDPHFGTEQPPVAEALVALCQQTQPNLLVLSGDITQRARREQFRQAKAWIDRLGAPVLAIPGNHDLPLFGLLARLRDPYARHREAFGDALEPAYASAELLVVGVNTTRWYRHKNGEVSLTQIEWQRAWNGRRPGSCAWWWCTTRWQCRPPASRTTCCAAMPLHSGAGQLPAPTW